MASRKSPESSLLVCLHQEEQRHQWPVAQRSRQRLTLRKKSACDLPFLGFWQILVLPLLDVVLAQPSYSFPRCTKASRLVMYTLQQSKLTMQPSNCCARCCTAMSTLVFIVSSLIAAVAIDMGSGCRLHY
ncbi:hypothetical protein V8B55DRAFT_1567548 [Mucor lusitanicus]